MFRVRRHRLVPGAIALLLSGLAPCVGHAQDVRLLAQCAAPQLVTPAALPPAGSDDPALASPSRTADDCELQLVGHRRGDLQGRQGQHQGPHRPVGRAIRAAQPDAGRHVPDPDDGPGPPLDHVADARHGRQDRRAARRQAPLRRLHHRQRSDRWWPTSAPPRPISTSRCGPSGAWRCPPSSTRARWRRSPSWRRRRATARPWSSWATATPTTRATITSRW